MIGNLHLATAKFPGPWCLLVAMSGLLAWTAFFAAAEPAMENFGLDDQMVDFWETADGLPQSTVTSITQTRDGYLWVGTLNGLACFDGNRFQIFDSLNMPGLRSNHITALLADPEGGLWIGTAEGGASRLFQGESIAYTTVEGLAHNQVRSLGMSGDGRIWIGTAAGVNVWHDGKLHPPLAGSDPAVPVLSICQATPDSQWLLCPDGLYEASASERKRLSPDPVDAGREGDWQGLAVGQGDHLWLFGKSLARLSVSGRNREVQGVTLESGDRITALLERRDGSLWLGTRSGRVRRVGHMRWESGEVAPSGPQPAVRCLFEDRELNLWVGLDGGGLARIKPKKVRSFGIRDGLPGEHVTGMSPDGATGFWIACHAAGIAHWSNGEFHPFDANGAWPTGCIVWSLLRTRDGSLWIGTEGAGLLRWKDERLERFGPSAGIPEAAILAMVETEDGSLWLGCRDGTLLRFRDDSFVRHGPDREFEGAGVTVLADDRQGGLWIGTDGHGLHHFSAGKFSRLTCGDGLGSDHVRTLMLDQEGVLWIGTSGGLTRLTDGVLANFSSRDGLWDNVISQILEDTLHPVLENQQLWLGSNRGVFRLRKTSFDDYLSGRIATLEPVVYGRAEGMDCLECSGGFSPAGLSQSPVENPEVKTLLLWFSTLRGLARLDVFPLVGLARGISGDHLAFTKAHLHLGPDDAVFDLGDVVAGGDGSGTGRSPGVKLGDGHQAQESATYAHSDSGTDADARYHRSTLPFIDGVFIPDGGAVPGRQLVVSSTGLTAEFPPTTGQAWGLLKSGFRLAGVDAFNPSEMRQLGIPMIWMSGNQGVTFDLEAIRRASGRTVERFTARAINLHIGPGSFHVLLDGRVVARRSGVVRDNDHFERGIIPLDIPVPVDARFLTLATTDDRNEIGAFNRVAPPVLIEEVRVDGALRKPDPDPADPLRAASGPGSLHPGYSHLEIRPGAKRLDLRYAAPCLVAPEKVRFRHRLEPLESDWVEAGGRRSANYSHLPPGSYRFLVTACNNDGVWNPQGAVIRLTIRPHFWQTGWFAPLWITCLVIAIAVTTGLVIRTRHRRHLRHLGQLHSLALERTRISHDIHDELGAGLTQVALLSELALADLGEPERAKTHLDQTFTVARRLARGVDEIVWAINPKNDALEFSLAYICKSAQDFLHTAGIACRLEWPEELPEGSLSSSQRHQLFLAVRESLTNVIKHASASEVRLRLSATATDLAIEISDNGCGFVPPAADAPVARHGLEGMAARMAATGGSFAVTSQAGRGTVVRLCLPLQAP